MYTDFEILNILKEGVGSAPRFCLDLILIGYTALYIVLRAKGSMSISRGLNSLKMIGGIICFLSLNMYASETTGTYAMDFLALNNSVKSESLGNAVTALSDTRAMSLNPSSIARTGGIDIQTHYLRYVESINVANVSAVIPFRKTVYGVSVGWMDFGKQLRTTITDKTGEAGDIFNNQGVLISLLAARTFSLVDAGLSIKKITQTLDSHQTDSLGLDIGATYHPNPELSIGTSLTNLTLKKSKDGSLQKEARLGFGYKLANEKLPLTGTLDILSRFESDIFLCAGAQYDITPVFSLRAGYNTVSDIAAFTAGIGLNLPQIHIDFSFRPSSEFGASYRVGIGIQF